MTNRQKSAAKHEFQIWPGFYLPGTSRLYISACALLIVVLALVVYWPSISGGFIFDDDLYLTDNQIVKSANGLYRLWFTTEPTDYYPLSNTALWLEWRLWGMNPTGYHATNLLLHIAEAMLIWIILRELSIPGGFLAAMLFAVHPVNVEAVAWIAQLKELLAMLFFLLAILWYIRYVQGAMPTRSVGMAPNSPLASHSSPLWYWLSLLAFILAMLSKASAAVLPVVLLGIIWRLRTGDCPNPPWRMRLSPSVREIIKTMPFFLSALLLTLVHAWFQTHGSGEVYRNAGFLERMLGAGAVVWFYLYKALWPVNLIFVYPQWHIDPASLLWWLPLIAAIAVTVVLFRYRKGRAMPFFLAWGFFCIALLPVMGFVDPGFMKYSLVADHYQHIAIVGVIALAAAGFSLWQRRLNGLVKWLATILAVAAVGVCAILAWQQSQLYGDAITLYQTTLQKNPACWAAHQNLGTVFVKLGLPLQAIDQYRQVLQLRPNNAAAYYNLGFALIKAGRPQEAIEPIERSLQLKPNSFQAHNNLGLALAAIDRTPDAVEQFQKALAIDADNAATQINLGNAYQALHQDQAAIEAYEKALKIDPDSSQANYNLGNCLKAQGQYQKAVEYYQKALQIKPDFPEVHNNLGNIFRTQGRNQAALEHYRQALQLNPDFAEAHINLGTALVELGRPAEAVEHYEQALRLSPDSTGTYINLILVYASLDRSVNAIETAQKALELARRQGQTEQAKQIEDWLDSYQKGK